MKNRRKNWNTPKRNAKGINHIQGIGMTGVTGFTRVDSVKKENQQKPRTPQIIKKRPFSISAGKSNGSENNNAIKIPRLMLFEKLSQVLTYFNFSKLTSQMHQAIYSAFRRGLLYCGKFLCSPSPPLPRWRLRARSPL